MTLLQRTHKWNVTQLGGGSQPFKHPCIDSKSTCLRGLFHRSGYSKSVRYFALGFVLSRLITYLCTYLPQKSKKSTITAETRKKIAVCTPWSMRHFWLHSNLFHLLILLLLRLNVILCLHSFLKLNCFIIFFLDFKVLTLIYECIPPILVTPILAHLHSSGVLVTDWVRMEGRGTV